MKFIILSDIHSNWEAITEFSKIIKEINVDEILCGGDIVGYGADPSLSIDYVQREKYQVVLGNHDAAVIDMVDTKYFNEYAKLAIEWTKKNINESQMNFLKNLPISIEKENFILFHSSPYRPAEWNYIITYGDAKRAMDSFNKQICFVGHSHQPIIIVSDEKNNIRAYFESEVIIERNKKYIINVGSIGQPRDGNPKGCFVIYDEEKKLIKFCRFSYNIFLAQEKIIKAGLPHFLGTRLFFGY
jgi:predicted phosphodiesterase